MWNFGKNGKVHGWSTKFPNWKKIKTRNYQRLNKLQNGKKSSSSKIVTSEAFQRVTDETGEPFKDWQKFGTTDEAQNFQIQIKKKMNKTESWKTK